MLARPSLPTRARENNSPIALSFTDSPNEDTCFAPSRRPSGCSGAGPRSRDRICPSLASRFASLSIERAQGDRVLRCTRSPERRKASGPERPFKRPGGPATFQCTSQTHHRFSRNNRPPCAMDVAAYSALSPVIRLLATVAYLRRLPACASSTPRYKRQDHTTSPSAAAPVVHAA